MDRQHDRQLDATVEGNLTGVLFHWVSKKVQSYEQEVNIYVPFSSTILQFSRQAAWSAAPLKLNMKEQERAHCFHQMNLYLDEPYCYYHTDENL